MPTCTVTGTLRNSSGVALPNTPVSFLRGGVSAQAGAVILERLPTTVSDEFGEIEIELLPGNYLGIALDYKGTRDGFAVAVPEAATADLADIINDQVAITPTLLAQAIAARDAAIAAANQAGVPYESRANFISADIPAGLTRASFFVGDQTYAVVRDAAGPIVQENGQRWRPDGDYNVAHFGAASDGTTIDTTAVQAAATWVSERNGTLNFPIGYTVIDDEIIITKAMRFVGQGIQANGQKGQANTLGIGTRLIWSGAGGVEASKAMIKFLPPNGTFMIAPEVDKLIVDCNSRAGFGVWVGAAWQPIIGVLHVHAPTDTGLYFYPEGNNTIVPQIHHYFMTVSASANCINASGLRAVPSETGFLTGGHYDHVRVNGPTAGTGVAFEIGNCDSAHVDYFTYFGFEGVGGRGFHASHDPAKPGGSCRKFFMDAFGGGRIKVDEDCHSITIRGTSENSAPDIHPNAHVNLELVDQFSGDHYQTLIYKFTDEKILGPAEKPVLTNVTETTQTSNRVQVLEFSSAPLTSVASWSFLIPPEWNHGAIVGMKLYYCTSLVEAANWQLRVYARAFRADGSGPINPAQFNSSLDLRTVPVPDTASVIEELRVDFSGECQVKKRMGVVCFVERLGADALDTATAGFRLVGVRLLYKSDGPNGGAGELRGPLNPMDVGPWSLEDFREGTNYDENVD